MAGDHTIRIVADLISSQFRKTNIVGRVGGDEFTVLMVNVSSMRAVRDKVNQLIQIMKYKPNLTLPENVTLSIGVASNGQRACAYQELFQKADEALYLAKQTGKARYREYGVEAVNFADDQRPSVLLVSWDRGVCSAVHTLVPAKLRVIEVLDVADLQCLRSEIRDKVVLTYADVSGENGDAADFWRDLRSLSWPDLSRTVAICRESDLKQYMAAASAGVVDVFTTRLDTAGFKRRSEKILKQYEEDTTSPLLDKLAEMDAEVEDTLERLSGDEDMYLTYLRQLPQNENIAAVFAAEPEKQTVRVGYYPVMEYQDKDADGNYWGFGYDYYIQIQKYTGWEYEFVETSYADCMEQLAAGEIDIISGVIPTDARREQMLFSDYSISNTQSKLYARMSDNEGFYEGYESFDGKTVAVMRGTLLTDLDDYQEKHHFTMTARAYDTLEQMEQALESGEVDLLYATSISETSATKIVARFHKISLYYGVSKAKPELLEELDGALQMIIDNNPNFYTQMSDKYMVSGANAFASFTEEEYAYTQSGTPVYVIMNPNWAPVSWYDEAAGAYRGIAADILDEISSYSGLQFVFCTDVEFRALMEKAPDVANDVLAILADDNTWAGRQNVMLSNRFVDASVVMVSKRGTHQTENAERIALPENFYISWKIAPTLPAEAITYYPTVEDCLKAINAGRADVTYLNELVSTYYLSTLEFSDLYASTKSGYDENLAFALNADTDKPLMGVINKSLLAIGDAELSQIVMQDSAATERVTLAGLFYANPVTFLLVTVLIMLILGAAIIAAVLMWSKRRRLAVELEREQENAAARTESFMMISHELRTPLNAIVGYLDMAAVLCAPAGFWGFAEPHGGQALRRAAAAHRHRARPVPPPEHPDSRRADHRP